ncbi:alpha/beta hydrolase [Brenneria uluponensis]|uniref:alpha/beta hydrolase n=1 Tax=Brenneria uluponensis TaxID=3057057 RepID=UPI0028F0C7FA|nr:alpha/beta hydrolase [Brenneria ulupoensis]
MNAILYKGMDRSQLDAAYDVAGATVNFSAVLTDFEQRSRHSYSSQNWLRDLNYGTRPRERYDFLTCGIPDAPTYVFIHGGYWSSSNKEETAFIAEGPHAHHMNVVLAEYSLAPHATMTEIVEEIGRLIHHLAADENKLGIAGCPLYLSGHSAGGHLAAMYRSHPAISGVHMLSAIVDLEPISLSWLQKKLKLSSKEVMKYSPLFNANKGAKTLISIGNNELMELKRHSQEYLAACKEIGEHVKKIIVPGTNHFTILNDLSHPDGYQMKEFINLL